jgi:hypothetical protein
MSLGGYGGLSPSKAKVLGKNGIFKENVDFINAKKLDFCINALEPLSDFHKSAENFLKFFLSLVRNFH